MSRITRALLALTVGFVGATAAVRALEQSTTDDAQYVGSPNFFEYCRDEYGPNTSALRSEVTATGWRCAAQIEGVFRLLAIDVSDICGNQYGDGAYAHSTDPQSPDSWQCLR